jgi:dolichyl-phosphate-mannose-protein mannosyltransferase
VPVTSTQIAPTTAAEGSGAGGEEIVRLRYRLLGYRPTDRFWGWAVPLLIAAIGGFARFWRLDQPHQLVFDETYYVKQAASYLRVGYELATNPDSTPKPDDRFTHGTVNVFLNSPDFVVHPPVGKWMIAFGEWVFGPQSSWGWRFSAAAVGTLSILMIGRIARRLFGSTLLGGVAALLLAVDGEAFVLSRTGLLDGFVMFWALAGFGCLLIDRDRSRARLAAKLAARAADRDAAQVPADRIAEAGPPPGDQGSDLFAPGAREEVRTAAAHRPVETGLEAAAGRFGPWLGIRWWRVAAAVCLGLSAGTKWSGAFFLAVFAVASLFWDISARRAARVRHWLSGAVLKEGTTAFVTVVPVALATYLASWAGWFHSKDAYYRQWGAQHPSKEFGWIPDSLRSLWKYHQDMYHFNVTLHTPHPYQSNPWSWAVLGRPTAFFYESPKQGVGGCTVAECSKAITDLGNPIVWWGGTLAIAVLLFSWALGRDWRAGAILAGLVAGYLPWFNYQDRTIYTFYAVAFVPWIVLALTFALGLVLGPPTADPRRRMYGAVGAGAVVLLAVLAFAFFYPVLTAQVIPRSDWSTRMWLPSWI